MDVSVIVPLFNEEDSVEPLHAALDRVLSGLGRRYEILFVDDGSGDATCRRAAELTRRDPRLRLIRLRRNCGQTAAMMAGVEQARGRVLVTMDGDLQNDPVDIPRFLETIEQGYDLVVGWRHNRQDKLLTRKIPSRIANWLIGKVTGVPIRDNGCSLKAYRAEVIKSVQLYSEMHRFIPAMSSTVGVRIAELRVRHHARRFGSSKYGLSRVYKVLVDLLVIKMITSFAYRPLLWFVALALPVALAAVTLTGYALLYALATGDGTNLPVAGSGVLLGALAVFLVSSGAVCELVTRTSHSPSGDHALITAQVSHPFSASQARDEE